MTSAEERHRCLVESDCRNLWHSFTQMQDWMAEEPLVIDAAEGVFLVDTLGRRYLDGVSSLWCNVHGHRVPEIDAAVTPGAASSSPWPVPTMATPWVRSPSAGWSSSTASSGRSSSR